MDFVLSPIAVLAQATPSPSLLSFFGQSGPMAKFVLGLLLLFSLGSWAIMIRKHLQLRRADRESVRFLEIFRKGSGFREVATAAGALQGSPLVGVFQAGYAEIDSQIRAHHPAHPPDPSAGPPRELKLRSLVALERTLKRAVGVETANLAVGAGFLATTAAASPFIGLFGTVWGIMVAFNEIGVAGSTSLQTVAPGIAEALINTAAGLFAAIPALVGYNHFAARLKRARARMEDFCLELLNLAERNFT
jgi:biopolymer transport protein TolQ